jgi:hypothetical protein
LPPTIRKLNLASRDNETDVKTDPSTCMQLVPAVEDVIICRFELELESGMQATVSPRTGKASLSSITHSVKRRLTQQRICNHALSPHIITFSTMPDLTLDFVVRAVSAKEVLASQRGKRLLRYADFQNTSAYAVTGFCTS